MNETTQQEKERQQPDKKAKDRDQHFTMEIQKTTMSPQMNPHYPHSHNTNSGTQ